MTVSRRDAIAITLLGSVAVVGKANTTGLATNRSVGPGEVSSPGTPQGAEARVKLVDVDFHVGGDNQTRQFEIRLGNWRKITVKRAVSPGGQGGPGSVGTGHRAGGGAGTPGGVLENFELEVVPLETLYVTIGAAANDIKVAGSGKSGSDGLAITSIRRGSHQGLNLLAHPTLWPQGIAVGKGGGAGTSAGAGSGAPPAGSRVSTQQGPKYSSAGGSGAFCPTQASPLPVSSATAVLDALAAIVPSTASGKCNVSPHVAAGGSAPPVPITTLRSNASGGKGGGFIDNGGFNVGSNAGQMSNMPGGASGGSASGLPSLPGGHGMLTLTVPLDRAVLDSWPASIVYNPASAITVNRDFFGMHVAGQPYAGAVTASGVTTGSDSGKLKIVGITIYPPSWVNIILTGGLPMAPLQLSTRYYLGSDGDGICRVYADRDRQQLLPVTSIGTGVTGTIYTDPFYPEFDFGHHRAFVGSGGIGSVGWSNLQPGNKGSHSPGTGSSVQINPTALKALDDLVAFHEAAGRKMTWCVKSCPGWSTTGTTNDVWGVPGGAGPPDSNDLGHIVKYVINRYNVERHPATKPVRHVEVYNEPIWGSAPNSVSPAQCAEMHRVARAAIAGSGDPTVRVVGPSMSSGPCLPNQLTEFVGYSARDKRLLQFLTATATSGGFGWQHIDVVSIHPYDYSTEDPPQTTKLRNGAGLGGAYEFTVQALMRTMRVALRLSGMPHWATMPIRLNEWGMADRAHLFANLTPAQTLVRTVAACLGLGFQGVDYFAYNWGDDPSNLHQSLSRSMQMQKAYGDLYRASAGNKIRAGGAVRVWDGSIRLDYSDGTSWRQ